MDKYKFDFGLFLLHLANPTLPLKVEVYFERTLCSGQAKIDMRSTDQASEFEFFGVKMC